MKKLFALLLLTPFIHSKDICDIKVNIKSSQSSVERSMAFNNQKKQCKATDILYIQLEGMADPKDKEQLLVEYSTKYCSFEKSIVIKGKQLACHFGSYVGRNLRNL